MLKIRLFWLFVWSMAFGLIEAAIVVYLRTIYYPDGFSFPIIPLETNIAVIEMIREPATLIIMWAVAELTFRNLQSKMAAYMILFGIWDIFYYLFLKAFLNWPHSLADWDILFLIPLPWVGPVWAPVVVSLGLIYAGSAILWNNEKGRPISFGKRFLLLEIAAGIIIVVSFLIPGRAVIHQTIPAHFPWYLFWTGVIAGLVTFHYQITKAVRG